MSVEKATFDTLLRDHAESVRRIAKLEENLIEQEDELVVMKIDVAKLNVKVGIYAGLGSIIGGGLVAIIISLITYAFKK